MLARQRHHLAHGRAGGHRDGVAQQARFLARHTRHLGRLLPGREVLVHDADAAFLGDGDRQAGFRHRVHGGATAPSTGPTAESARRHQR